MKESMPKTYIDVIAERIYLASSKGDPMPARPEGEPLIPAKDAPLYRMYAVLALAKGTATCSADVHDAWSAWQAGIDPTHKSLVPFEKLSRHVQGLDHAYVNAIHEIAKSLPA